MLLSISSRLGPYEVLSPIGAGGMGEVYRARDAKLGRDVALKVLPEAFARDAERMARFQREAKSLASLNHSNIASIYGLEDSGTIHALVMELVEGPTLADRIKAGAIPIEEALPIAKQICEGLEYAHERGIVHRDLKPSNVKVTSDDAVKILDFGLAKTIEVEKAFGDMTTSPTLSAMATQSGVLLGTAVYMSPEQAKGKAVDRRTDIWAFGCVLYEMLTGKMAFRGDAVTEVLAAIIKEDPDWSQLPSETPVGVRVLLRRCLQKDPKQRLRDIGDARVSLDEILTGAPEPSPIAAAPSPAPLWHRTLPWTLFATATVALMALAFVHFRESPPLPAESVRFQIPLPEKVTLSVTGAFALSPDGRLLAFGARGADGVSSLWIRGLDSLEARPLGGSEFTTSIFPPFIWSFDSRSIAFNAGGKLKKIDISSGVAQTLCNLPDNEVGGSWSRDGVIIFGTANGGIMRVSAIGGLASPLTTLDSSRGESNHVFPSFLPDERHFIYMRASGKAAEGGLYIGSLDARPEQQDSKRLLATGYGAIYVPSSDPDSGELLYDRDGTLIAQPFDPRRLELSGEGVTVAEDLRNYAHYGLFSASRNGVLVYRTGLGGSSQLTWFDRQGKRLGTVGTPGEYLYPALSPDGKRAAVSQRDPQTGKPALWLVDLSRGTSTRLTFDPRSADYPIWSPDGNRIIFTSNINGIFDLYQKAASGVTDEEPLVKSNEAKVPESLSRDGRFLLYDASDPKTKHDLWVLPSSDDKKPFPFLQTEFNELSGHFSPDGRWVAYQSDESGRYEIYVRKFSPGGSAAASDSGGKWQVSYGGGREARWSADGKQLYYLTLDWKVMAVDVTTNPVFQAQTPKLLFQAPPQPAESEGEYTVDGKRFLFLAPAQQTGQAPFTVVLNWQVGLKK